MKTVTHKVLPSSVFLIGLGAGLWIPDTDLILLPVLHHRSIVTHSILIPWLLSLTAGGRVPLSTVAGLYGGIASGGHGAVRELCDAIYAAQGGEPA